MKQSKSDNIVHLKVIGSLADPVFFTKSQVRIGTKLINVGRRNNLIPMEWEVTRIYTYSIVRGQYRSRRVETVNKLSDAIELVPVNAPKGYQRKFLELSFDYLSYSAIWRIL